MDDLELPMTNLGQLGTEVLSKPSVAALPSALSDRWLELIARDLEAAVGDGRTESMPPAPVALVLHLLLAESRSQPVFVSFKAFERCLLDYRLAIAIEKVRRCTAIPLRPATLSTIFSDRQIRAHMQGV